jgi:hypothetical protein
LLFCPTICIKLAYFENLDPVKCRKVTEVLFVKNIRKEN